MQMDNPPREPFSKTIVKIAQPYPANNIKEFSVHSNWFFPVSSNHIRPNDEFPTPPSLYSAYTLTNCDTQLPQIPWLAQKLQRPTDLQQLNEGWQDP